ncbi:MAG: DUF3035 domain-containing protein [Pseudomonadota bacterium]
MPIETSSAIRCLILGAALTAAGCDRIGNPFDALSQKQKGPDEFSVISRAPLVMPPSRQLPEPSPGTVSPLDPNPQRAAIAALTGRGDSFAASTAGVSAGEQVLLESANAAAASPDIRILIEQERIEAEENAEYEPPTIFEVLGGPEKTFDEEDVIDPNAESRRLQQAGVTAPVNPFEEPEAAPRPSVDPDAPTEFPGENDADRRPNNRLPPPG